jgi:hypothetical protein
MFDSQTYLRCECCGGYVNESEAGAHENSCSPQIGQLMHDYEAEREYNDAEDIQDKNPMRGVWGTNEY